MKTTTTDTHIKAEMSLERLAAMADNGQKLYGLYDQNDVLDPASLQWAVSAPFTDAEVVASAQSFLDANDHRSITADELAHELASDGEFDGMGDAVLEYHIPRFTVELPKHATVEPELETISEYHGTMGVDEEEVEYQDYTGRYLIKFDGETICEAFFESADGEAEEQMYNAGYLATDTRLELDGQDCTVYIMASDAKKFNFSTL